MPFTSPLWGGRRLLRAQARRRAGWGARCRILPAAGPKRYNRASSRFWAGHECEETPMKFKALALASLAVAAFAAPALAHHSFAMFDADKTMTLNGTVTDFEWTNPHSWIRLTVADNGGTLRPWAIEMGSPAANTQR